MQKENLYTKDCIRTFTGIYMNVFEPTVEMINIEDIAHALSNVPRFGGHLPNFYSVAQHSVMASRMCDDKLKFQALLHDASEAYLLDVPKPIKERLSEYKIIEDNLMKLIAGKYKFKYPLSKEVKEADEIMLKWEWGYLMLNDRVTFPEIPCWPPKLAKEKFLQAYNEYKK